MRVTTSQLYDRSLSRLTDLNAKADKLQGQIATNKRLTSAADDSVAWQRLDGIKRAGADDTTFQGNISLAQGFVANADLTLESMSTQLQRANELAIKANNDTLSAENRASIADELDGIIDDLLGLANAKDARGQPVFGGTGSETAFTKAADGSINYTGSGEPATIPIGADSDIQVSLDGAKVFGGSGGGIDVFAGLAALSDAVRSGGDIATGIDTVQAAQTQVTAARASVGARGARLDLEAGRLTDIATSREATRSKLEDTDITAAITELQKTLTVLQATQSSFTKLQGLSLFNYLQ